MGIAPTHTKIADIRFDSDPGPLFVGVQANAQFDNLAIVPLPAAPSGSGK